MGTKSTQYERMFAEWVAQARLRAPAEAEARERAAELHEAALRCLRNAEMAARPEVRLAWAMRSVEMFQEACDLTESLSR